MDSTGLRNSVKLFRFVTIILGDTDLEMLSLDPASQGEIYYVMEYQQLHFTSVEVAVCCFKHKSSRNPSNLDHKQSQIWS